MPEARLRSIQLLRGLAALLVVAHHAIGVTEHHHGAMTGAFLPLLPAAVGFGATGVDLFFVISGFVMAHTIGRAGGEIDAISFLARRAIRILPLFWLLSLFYIAWGADPGIDHSSSATVNTVTLLPLFDRDIYHCPPLYVGWTLGFECAFYLIVAAVLLAGRRRPVEWLGGATLLAAVAGLFIHTRWLAADFLLNPIVGEFALGVGAWLLWRRGLPRGLAGPLAALGVTALFASLCLDNGHTFSVHFDQLISGQSSERRLLIWGMPWALVLTGLVCDESPEGRLSRWLAQTGDASYALYLAHPFVITAATLNAPSGWLLNPYVLVAALVWLSLAAGLVVHRGIERPLLRLGRRRPLRQPGTTTAVRAPLRVRQAPSGPSR